MRFMDEKRAKQLHYDVMGIALAIRGHAGESGVYREIDAALTAQDWDTLAAVQRAFGMLSEERQALIMSEMDDPDEIGRSIALFERRLRTVTPAKGRASA